jgi:hypothetical protein
VLKLAASPQPGEFSSLLVSFRRVNAPR